MGEFRRGLSDRFVAELEVLAEQGGWWAEVLADKNLIIGIRDEYLNVYWQGQSLFKVDWKNNRVAASTHPKYLLNPDLSEQIPFDAYEAIFGGLPDGGLTSIWEQGTTLGRLKRAARRYAGAEKRGVHRIAIQSDNLIDVEVAVTSAEQANRSAPRLDFAIFEPDGASARLIFWEAKTFYNRELKASGKKSVVQQIARYRRLLSDADLRQQVLKSYQVVASNLVSLGEMSGGARTVGAAIRGVADGGHLILGDPPDVNLVIYGFDLAQRDKIWRPLKAELAKALGATRIVAKGTPSGITLHR